MVFDQRFAEVCLTYFIMRYFRPLCVLKCGDGLLSCLFRCSGGIAAAAWKYYVDVGLVTGGNYNSGQV